MFLWCGCHCAEESQSTPPNPGSESVSFLSESIVSASVTGSVPPPPQPPRVGCDVCTFGVAPAVYEFEWNYTGKAVKPFPPRPCCSAYTSQQKYRLLARTSNDANICNWSSDEQIKWRKLLPPFGTTATCADNGVGRVTLAISRNNANIVSALAIVNYDDSTTINAVAPQIRAQAIYRLVDANGNPLFVPGGKIGCLQQLRFRATWAIEGRPKMWFRSTTIQGVPYGSPCDQDSFSMIDSGLPEYVTCTPAPA